MDAVKVMEIHSHHTMRPIPSSRDNLSEIVPGMYYCIVGSFQKTFPEIPIRRKRMGEGWDKIPFNEVFENPFETIPRYFNMEFIDFENEDSELTEL